MKLPLHPWPLGIVIFFAVAIVFVLSFIGFSLRQRMDMVAPDYYARELKMQGEIEALRRARTAPVQAVLIHEASSGRLLLRWSGPEAPPIQGSLEFYRPSDAALDFTVPFALSPGGALEIPAGQLRAGFWRVDVKWSVGGQEFLRREELLL